MEENTKVMKSCNIQEASTIWLDKSKLFKKFSLPSSKDAKLLLTDIKIQRLINNLRQDTGIYMKSQKFQTFSGVVILHPKKGTDWIGDVEKFFSLPNDCAVPKLFLNILKTSVENVFIQNLNFIKDYSFCGSYFF